LVVGEKTLCHEKGKGLAKAGKGGDPLHRLIQRGRSKSAFGSEGAGEGLNERAIEAGKGGAVPRKKDERPKRFIEKKWKTRGNLVCQGGWWKAPTTERKFKRKRGRSRLGERKVYGILEERTWIGGLMERGLYFGKKERNPASF